jgi:hypothetical protein
MPEKVLEFAEVHPVPQQLRRGRVSQIVEVDARKPRLLLRGRRPHRPPVPTNLGRRRHPPELAHRFGEPRMDRRRPIPAVLQRPEEQVRPSKVLRLYVVQLPRTGPDREE